MKKKSTVDEPKTRVIETFRYVNEYTVNNLKQYKFDCFNGFCSVRKYRITIELIDEPTEIICQRIQELWDKSFNYHDYEPLKKEAKKYGYEIKRKP
jgi:hypothetical protein